MMSHLLLLPMILLAKVFFRKSFGKANTWQRAQHTPDVVSLPFEIRIGTGKNDSWISIRATNVPAVIAAAAVASGANFKLTNAFNLEFLGYKSSWHEKITGSLFFICDVLDDGDSGQFSRFKQVYPPPHQRPQLRAEDICCTGFQDLVS
ncbi:Phosphatidylinositol 4-kinase alpha 1 [Vitis vinifera]|uniref:Phosphatidylinositol 4-kinase alpha 1 n=1 Tax=Vitis vinifera TaxID=29760 RepID=A0A438HWV0_VITVI|nr:Phosphatidylinositol 4-kinase alpha 1 [Vitis vinifera]